MLEENNWPIEKESLDIIIEWMKTNKPKFVVELGSGESTREIAKYCDVVWTYEHKSKFLVPQSPNVAQWLVHLKDGQYDIQVLPDKIDMLLIDGPEGIEGNTRMPVKRLLERVHGTIFIHDTKRQEEIKIANKLGNPTFHNTRWGLGEIKYGTNKE